MRPIFSTRPITRMKSCIYFIFYLFIYLFYWGVGGWVLSSNAFTIWCCIPIIRPPRVIRRFKRRSCLFSYLLASFVGITLLYYSAIRLSCLVLASVWIVICGPVFCPWLFCLFHFICVFFFFHSSHHAQHKSFIPVASFTDMGYL